MQSGYTSVSPRELLQIPMSEHHAGDGEGVVCMRCFVAAGTFKYP